VLIIWRSKLCYAASGIITHVGGRPVHGAQVEKGISQPAHRTDGHLQSVTIPDAV